MARYSLFVLKVPLNTNQPTNRAHCTLGKEKTFSGLQKYSNIDVDKLMLLALLLLLALIAPQQSPMTSCIHIILPVSAPTTCRRNSIGGDLGGGGMRERSPKA